MSLTPRAVRLRHPTLRNCIFTIEQQSRIYPVPHECGQCFDQDKRPGTHIFKTFHLILNQHGETCVAEGIYELFERENMLGELEATREVTPMPTIIGVGGPINRAGYIVSREHGERRLGGVDLQDYQPLRQEA